MVAKSYILFNLRRLNSLYQNSHNPKNSLFYSKLAILELCGWIEESMDDIVLKCAKRKLKNPTYFRDTKNFIDKKIHGFHYNNHFRSMLVQLVGVIQLESIENKIDPTTFQNFKSVLGLLKIRRDNEAHSHLKGIARTIDAPSVTLNNCLDVYQGLKCFEDEIRKL